MFRKSSSSLMDNLSDRKSSSHIHEESKLALIYHQIESIEQYREQLQNCQFDLSQYDLYYHRQFLKDELNNSLFLLHSMVEIVQQYDEEISRLAGQLKDYERKASMFDALEISGKNLVFKRDSHSPSQKKSKQAFEAEIQILFAKLKNQERMELSRMKEEVSHLKEEIELLTKEKEQIGVLNARNKSLQQEKSCLKEENNFLRKELYDKCQKVLKMKAERANSRKLEQAERRHQQPELVIYQRKLNNLNFSPIDHREIGFDDISFNNEYFEENTENKLLKGQIEELQLKLREQIEKGDKILDQNEHLLAKTEEMENQIQQTKHLREKWDEIEENYTKINEELGSKLNELASLRKTVDSISTNEQSLKNEIASLKSKLAALEQQNQKHIEQKMETCDKCSSLQAQKAKLQRQVSKLTVHNSLMQAKINQMIELESNRHRGWEQMLRTINSSSEQLSEKGWIT